MRFVTAFFPDGNTINTSINGTVPQIIKYYLHNYFNLGTVDDNMQLCVGLIITEPQN
jgi:hypothetical protein